MLRKIPYTNPVLEICPVCNTPMNFWFDLSDECWVFRCPNQDTNYMFLDHYKNGVEIRKPFY